MDRRRQSQSLLQRMEKIFDEGLLRAALATDARYSMNIVFPIFPDKQAETFTFNPFCEFLDSPLSFPLLISGYKFIQR
jgi:hypothetical protein